MNWAAPLILTADHGNCEQMIAVEKHSGKPIAGPGGTYKPLTSHTVNPVPFVVHGANSGCFELNRGGCGTGTGQYCRNPVDACWGMKSRGTIWIRC